MKKGMMLGCVVGLASISLLGLAGGATAAKDIGDREVGARNISNNAIHCRSLDKYLKGHLCGPNATVKKGGVAGPQGPPGPPGPGGGGATEVFYVESAINPQSTIFQNAASGLTIKADCALNDNLGVEITTTKADGVLRTAAVIGDDNVEYNNADLDAGVSLPPLVFEEALLTLSYITSAGDVLTGTFQVDSQTNGAFGDSKDCVFAGHMNVS